MRGGLKRKGSFQLLVKDYFCEIYLRKIMKIYFSSWHSVSEFLERSIVVNSVVRIAEIPPELVSSVVKIRWKVLLCEVNHISDDGLFRSVYFFFIDVEFPLTNGTMTLKTEVSVGRWFRVGSLIKPT